MGLAPYGEPKYKDLILKELIDLREDGSFRLNMEYFDFATGLTMTNEKFSRLFGGPPRKPESELTQREMDLARSVQEVTEEAVLRIGRHVRRETGQKHLCLAGGVGLGVELGTSEWWLSRPVWIAMLFVFLLPVALLLSPLERRGRPADAPIPAAARQIAGAMMICLGIALLAMYGYGGGPVEHLDLASFAMVIVGSGISGLLPKFR